MNQHGLKVAIIKFSHSEFTIDPQHKDSLLFRDSKAQRFTFLGPFEQVTYQRVQERRKPKELFQWIGPNIDVILCESYPRNSPKIPLIFAIKDHNDYLETKKRYNNQIPIFITGKTKNISHNHIESIPILSINQDEQKRKIRNLILDEHT